MATISVVHTCKHTADHRAGGGPLERASYAARLAAQLCPECETAEARAWASKRGLPTLAWGSDRQMAWAEVIRARVMREIDQFLTEPSEVEREAIRRLGACTRSRYWISRQHVDPAALVAAWARNVQP